MSKTQRKKSAAKRYWSCGRKVLYQTEQSAHTAVEAMRLQHSDDQIEAYKCQFCAGWHVDHRLSISKARRALKKPAIRGMEHPNFRLKAPTEVVERMSRWRDELIKAAHRT